MHKQAAIAIQYYLKIISKTISFQLRNIDFMVQYNFSYESRLIKTY